MKINYIRSNNSKIATLFIICLNYLLKIIKYVISVKGDDKIE